MIQALFRLLLSKWEWAALWYLVLFMFLLYFGLPKPESRLARTPQLADLATTP